MQVTHTDCETVQLLPTSRGVMNLENEKERAQFSFRSHCRSEKDSEVPALLKTGFSAIISLSISSAVRWTQDNHRGCSALSLAPRHGPGVRVS